MFSKKRVYDFLASQNHVVVATVNKKGNPQAATVGFGQNKKLEIIFGTDLTTRKVQNISHNNNVAIVVNGENHSVQLEGKASLLEGDELKKLQKLFFKKMPGMQKYSLLTNQIYYKITPHWIRFIDHTASPGKVSEITF